VFQRCLARSSAVQRDDHEQTRLTAPNARPLSPRLSIKVKRDQCSSSHDLLLHNHPSGDPTPSRADIDMTRAIVEVARPLGIVVHDHLIVGKNGHASLKALKLM
jgi:DNA repair protein RadC